MAMRISRILQILLISIAFTQCIKAVTNLPPGGESLVLTDTRPHQWAIYPGNNQGPVLSAKQVSVEHTAFQHAMQVDVRRPSGHFYNGSISLPTDQPVRAGDTLLAHLYFRSIHNKEETGDGFATVFIQGPKPNYKKYLIHEITASNEWQEYFLPLKVTDNLPRGQLRVHVGAGGGSKPQIWEIGGLELLNYGSATKISNLPQSKATYTGRAADAAWRIQANERIERLRKGDFRLRIVTAEGHPIEGANIEMRQQRHAYHFGSVITGALLTGHTKDSEIYRKKVLELFNQSGTENDLKWGPWENEWGQRYRKEQTIEALQWLKAHQFYTRGHVLVWPSRKHLPERLHPYLPIGDLKSADPAAMQVVLDHIKDITTATADYLDEWDVINEPYYNHDLMDAFGPEIMLDWFEEARAHLPTQKLYLNDAGILSGKGRDLAHQQHYEATLRYLLDNDAPVTGMGMQGHFSGTPTAIERVYEILDHFHTSFPQLDIRVTEFDIQTDDEQLQADYTRDLLTIVFSHPATVGVQCWGFWAGAHWRPESAMYTKDWREKPSAQIWKQLTKETWWTNLSGELDSEGTFAGRGFYGDYTIRVTHEGIVKEHALRIEKNAENQFIIQFPLK